MTLRAIWSFSPTGGRHDPSMDTSRHDELHARIAAADHPEWGAPDQTILQRIVPGFVLSTWAMCLAASVLLAAVGLGIIALISSRPLFGETNTELGVAMIVSAMATFIGFSVVMVMRLPHVSHDRLVNSLSVAAVHVGFAVLLFATDLLVRVTTGSGAGSIFTGPWTDELGNAFTILERSSAAAIAACLLAVGMVPARGPRPAGTQTELASQDEQL